MLLARRSEWNDSSNGGRLTQITIGVSSLLDWRQAVERKLRRHAFLALIARTAIVGPYHQDPSWKICESAGHDGAVFAVAERIVLVLLEPVFVIFIHDRPLAGVANDEPRALQRQLERR